MRINKSSMLYNISVLVVSGTLFQMMGFVYQVMLSRTAGAEALGIFRLVMPVYSIAIVTAIGIRMALTSLAAGLDPRAGRRGLRRLMWQGIFSFVFLFLLVAVPVVVLHDWIAVAIIREPRTSLALLIILVCVFLSGFEGVFEALFLGLGRTKYAAISNLLEQASKIIIILLFMSRYGGAQDGAKTAVIIVTGMTLSEIPVIIWLVIVWLHEMKHGGWQEGDLRYASGRVLPIALPVALCSAATSLIASASTVLLPERLGLAGYTHKQALEALGVIGEMALPLLLLPMVLVRSLSNVLLPVISQSTARQNSADIGRKIEKSFQATGLLVLPATAILAPLAGGLSRILYRHALNPGYVLLLATAAVLTYYEVVSASILNGLGYQRRSTLYLIAGECIQLFFTFFCAASKNLHIYGYILGMAVSPLVVLMLNLWLIQKKTKHAPDYAESFVIPFAVACVAGGFTHFFYRLVWLRTAHEGLSLSAGALVGVGVCAACFMLTGLRPVRYLKTLALPKRR